MSVSSWVYLVDEVDVPAQPVLKMRLSLTAPFSALVRGVSSSVGNFVQRRMRRTVGIRGTLTTRPVHRLPLEQPQISASQYRLIAALLTLLIPYFVDILAWC